MDAAGKLGFSQLRMTTVEAAQGKPDGLRRPFARRLVRRASGPGAAASAGGAVPPRGDAQARALSQWRSASYRAPVPVIVVGNITVGGTGKTPMILWLIEHCRQRGLKVGVVSRGYGAKPPQPRGGSPPSRAPNRPATSRC
jgi:hypothetical protein